MTAEADLIRDQRRAFAHPGGAHDRLIAFLSKALPAVIGVIAAVMILSPLSPRGEISFLLDRNKVAITNARVQVDDATYRGQDGNGRPFTVSAGSAVQKAASVPVVAMQDLIASIQLSSGPAKFSAESGSYNYNTEQVDVTGPVNFAAADGYRMVTRDVSIDLKARKAVGQDGVEGAVPTGTFRADRILADFEERTITLDGHARLRMTPGKLRMPQ